LSFWCERQRLIPIGDLPFVQQDEKPVAIEGGDGFVKLLSQPSTGRSRIIENSSDSSG
jgi:hypothetical protein